MKPSHSVLILFIFFILFSARTFAQGENNVWAFGDKIGLDFNSGVPTLIRTGIHTIEDCGSVCDGDGNLLFYSGDDAFSTGVVFDRTHNVMPNGSDMLGNRNTSATQGVRIIPFMDGSSRYHLFIQSAYEDFLINKMTYLYYSVVDMSLNGGLGDVDPAYKNIIIDSFTSEKMTATLGIGCSAWLIVHRADTSVLHAFHIDASGLNTAPVVSGFSSDRSFSMGFDYPPYMSCGMDMSPNGTILARCRNKTPSKLELFDFDKSTGIFSNDRTLDDRVSYWLQFSPDGSKLYTTSPFAQYDMSLMPSVTDVKASRYIIRDSNENSGMRNGPDGKLYTFIISPRATSTQVICRLNNPNAAGASCGYIRYMTLPSGLKRGSGLGQGILVPPPSDSISSRQDTNICFTPFGTIVAQAGYSGYTWDDGTKGKIKTVLSPGKSWVKMRKGCTMYIDTIYYTAKALNLIATKHDTTICFSHPISIKAPAGKGRSWYDGTTDSIKTFSSAGIFWVKYFNGECNLYVDTFNIIASTAFDSSFHIVDTIACLARAMTVSLSPGYEFYKWYDGSTATTHSIVNAGKYWAASYNNCFVRIDSFRVKEQAYDSSFYHTDTVACLMQPLILTVPAAYDAYQWFSGSTSGSQAISAPGKYWLLSFKNCTVRVDSFSVYNTSIDTSFFNNNDTVCFSGTTSLSAPAGFDHYLWDNGITAASISTDSSTAFRVVSSFNDDCKVRVDTFATRFINFSISLPFRDSFCSNLPLTLDATAIGTADATYKWSNGQKDASIKVSANGTYTVSVQSGPCALSHAVTVVKKDFEVDLGPDQRICEGQKIVLADKNIAYGQYLWQDNSKDPTFTAEKSGTYVLKKNNDECVAEDSVNIEVINCSNCIALPNAFTPNDDGKNDTYQPIINCPVKSYVFKVFNRYGQEVFGTQNPADKWNGKLNAKELETGVYFYLLKVQLDIPDAKEELLKGDVSLLR